MRICIIDFKYKQRSRYLLSYGLHGILHNLIFSQIPVQTHSVRVVEYSLIIKLHNKRLDEESD